MQPDNEYLNHVEKLISDLYAPVAVKELPKGLSLFSTEQLIQKFQSFVPDGVLTKDSVYALMQKMGFELAEIKPFSYVWICIPKLTES